MENHHLLSIYDTIFMLTWFLRNLFFNFIDFQIKTLHYMEKFPLFHFFFNWSHSLQHYAIFLSYFKNLSETSPAFSALGKILMLFFALVFTKYFDFLYASRGCVILEKSLLLSNAFPVWYFIHIVRRVWLDFFKNNFYWSLELLHFQFIQNQRASVGRRLIVLRYKFPFFRYC